MSIISELTKELLGQEVTVVTRTTDQAFGGIFAAIELGADDSRMGPTVALKDEEGLLSFVFDVSSLTPGIVLEEEVEEEEVEEDEEEEDEEEDEEEYYSE